MKLWTIISDYGGTGEGRTIQALITYAENEKHAINLFGEEFDPFFAKGAEAIEGIVENEIIQYLFNERVLNDVSKMEGKANIKLASQLHFNFS